MVAHTAHAIQTELRSQADQPKSLLLARFFKINPGGYAEGDVFLGITVPATRLIVKKYARDATLDDFEYLIQSRYHEERLTALLILVYFAEHRRYPIEELAKEYLSHIQQVNNWDLVDQTSPQIIGPYVCDYMARDERKKFIDACITSGHLWTVRTIVLASFHAIRNGDEKMIVSIASRLLNHKHDLIHKAVGWMLREMGKRVSEQALCSFLDDYAPCMPRTMLRYAIERLPEAKRLSYMRMKRVV
ncbi:MAG: DNA alkylation repair protein [Candidatus Roizmanbacteria bacterium]